MIPDAPGPGRVVAAASIATVLAGCSSFQPPGVSVVEEASLGMVTDEALRFDIRLDCTNPNREPIELLEFRYSVTLDGKPVFTGRRAGEATLPAAGAATLELPAIVRYDMVGWTEIDRPGAAGWGLHGELIYVTPGELAEILLDTGVRTPRQRFRAEGHVALIE